MRLIFLAYGGGGHREQMTRLIGEIGFSGLTNVEIHGLSEQGVSPVIDRPHTYFVPIRDKHAGISLHSLVANFSGTISILNLVAKYRKRVILFSTGPGLSVLPALAIKLVGGLVVHVETWSRFYSKSYTGALMYWIADHFLIQNATLSTVYPRAHYSGRL